MFTKRRPEFWNVEGFLACRQKVLTTSRTYWKVEEGFFVI